MIDSRKIISFRKAPDAEAGTYLWSVPKDFPYFQGHFPDMPVLPAVACIDVSLEVVRLELKLEIAPFYRAIKTAKFTGMVQPEDEITLLASRLENTWKVLWSKGGVRTADIRLAF